MNLLDPRAYPMLTDFEYPLLFVTISGSHLYGFSSPDSDVDLRGVHVVPTRRILSLKPHAETIDRMGEGPNPEDLVTQEVAKFFAIGIKNSGYCLEQVLSPLVVVTSPWHEELRDILPRCVRRDHAKHYLGFTQSQLSILRRRPDKQVKVVLYLFRSVLTGIHFARTGRVEANLRTLNETFRLSFIDDLIAEKIAGGEKDALIGGHQLDFYLTKHAAFVAELERAFADSSLPLEADQGATELDDLLYRIRTSDAFAELVPPSLPNGQMR